MVHLASDNLTNLFPVDMSTYNAAREKENNVIGQRIAEARKNTGLSLIAFSKLMAGYGVVVSASSISKWESGLTTPSGYQLMALSHALNLIDMFYYFSSSYRPKLDPAGQQKLKEYEQDLIASGLYAIHDPVKIIQMPISDLRVSAGAGQILDSNRFESIDFPESEVPEGATFGVRISGDSMEPVYHNGDIAWVQPCTQLSIGEVGIFAYDGSGYIKVYNEKEPPKRLKTEFSDSYGHLYKQPVLVSYNCKYDPIDIIPSSGFQILGRVLN